LRAQVAAKVSGVPKLKALILQIQQGFQEKLGLATPSAIDGGFADSGSLGDGIDSEILPAHFAELFQARFQDLMVNEWASGPS